MFVGACIIGRWAETPSYHMKFQPRGKVRDILLPESWGSWLKKPPTWSAIYSATALLLSKTCHREIYPYS